MVIYRYVKIVITVIWLMLCSIDILMNLPVNYHYSNTSCVTMVQDDNFTVMVFIILSPKNRRSMRIQSPSKISRLLLEVCLATAYNMSSFRHTVFYRKEGFEVGLAQYDEKPSDEMCQVQHVSNRAWITATAIVSKYDRIWDAPIGYNFDLIILKKIGSYDKWHVVISK